MKKAVLFIVYSNILISFCAGMLAYGTASFQSLLSPVRYFWFIFGATLFVYNAQRLLRLQELNDSLSSRHQWIIQNKKTVLLISFGGLAISIFWFIRAFFDVRNILFFGFFGIISMFYSFSITTRLPSLRELPFVKIHLIALTWTASCVFFPLLNKEGLNQADWGLIFAVYLYFVAITIPFDIRDLPYDKEKQKTIPQVLGKRNAVVLACLLTLFSLFISVFFHLRLMTSPFFYLAYSYQFILILLALKKRTELFYSGGIDGGIILLGLGLSFL